MAETNGQMTGGQGNALKSPVEGCENTKVQFQHPECAEIDERLRENYSFKFRKSYLRQCKLWRSCCSVYYVAMTLGAFPAKIFESSCVSNFLKIYSFLAGGFVILLAIRSLEFVFIPGGVVDKKSLFEFAFPAYNVLNVIGWIWSIRAARELPNFTAKIESLLSISRTVKTCPYYVLFVYSRIVAVFIILSSFGNAIMFTMGVYGIVKFPIHVNVFIIMNSWTRPLYLLMVFPIAFGAIGHVMQSLETLMVYMAMRSYNYWLYHGCLFRMGIARVFRQEYQRLIDVIEYLDEKWSWYYLWADGVLILIICINLFMVGAERGGEDTVVMGGFVFWLVYGVSMVVLTNIPPSLLNEASYKSLDILMRKINQRMDHISECGDNIKQNLSEQDEDLQHLYHQIANHKTSITAGNFFVINRTTLLTIASAVLTYFIIIIQFSSTRTIYEGLLANSTMIG